MPPRRLLVAVANMKAIVGSWKFRSIRIEGIYVMDYPAAADE